MTSSSDLQPGSRPRVVHLLAPAPVGGAESVVRALASSRRRYSGHTEVVALVDDSGAEVFLQQLRASGVPTAAVREGRRRYFAQVGAVAHLLARTRADLIHTHVYHADFIGYLAARRCGLPAIATYHGHVGGGLRNLLYEWLDRHLLRRFDAVICVSRHNRDRLTRAGCDPARLHLVENGVDAGIALSRESARQSLGVSQTGLVVGWVGRLSPEKGPDLFLHALAHIKLPNVAAVLVGAGAERPRLLGLTRDLGLEPAVSLVGQRPDAASLLPAFDLLVSSSRTEGLPMILLEAMALGIPIVAFGVGGIPEILTDASAWLVQPSDVGALGAAIREALTNRDNARRRAERAYEAIRERFSASRWVANVDTVYASVTGLRRVTVGDGAGASLSKS
jgi:glycosyltransferase involved in cell wall biosynthesis